MYIDKLAWRKIKCIVEKYTESTFWCLYIEKGIKNKEFENFAKELNVVKVIVLPSA